MCTRSKSGENAELVFYSNEYFADQNPKSALCYPTLVGCPHMTQHTILISYSLETKLKITFFSMQIFQIPVANVYFFLGESIISNRLVCLNEMVVLMFSLKKEKPKNRVERIIFIRNVVYKRKVLEPNRVLPSLHLSSPRRLTTTIAVHVCYNSWYISLSSSAKQQREMTKFCVF